MPPHEINGSFVSEKINKIRWRPYSMDDSDYFITGSWDNDQNTIKLWNLDSDLNPFSVAELPHNGDVTEAKFLNGETFASSSSRGSMFLLKINSTHTIEPTIEVITKWESLHKYTNEVPSSCTAFATCDNDIVSIGEDGSINFLNAKSDKIVRNIKNADSCSLNCVTFLKYNEILVANLMGQLKIFDIRNTQNVPTTTFLISGEPITPLCLANHPSQRHIVMAGDEEGSITIWDLRYNSYPVNVLDAHEGGVNEIQFHPDRPDQLLTCSSAGDIWHWSSKVTGISSGLANGDVWLASDAIKNKLDVFTLMPKLHKPINSLDILKNKVLCGCDNEAIYLINGINVF